MKILASPKRTFMILLAAILLCASTSFTAAKADAETHDIKLLMLYDDSYDSFLDEHSMGSPSERIRQLLILSAIPFELQWDIVFDVTVSDYASVLGTDSALNCDAMHPLIDPLHGRERVWLYRACCNCQGLNHLQHHSNSTHYSSAAYNYTHNQVSPDPYDDVGIMLAHYLCFGGDITHYEVDGTATLSNPGFSVSGSKVVNTNATDTDQFLNLLYTKQVFSHEISHNFGTSNWDSSSSPCSVDCPCVMNTGFYSVIYVRDAWCPACHTDFTPDQFD